MNNMCIYIYICMNAEKVLDRRVSRQHELVVHIRAFLLASERGLDWAACVVLGSVRWFVLEVLSYFSCC